MRKEVGHNPFSFFLFLNSFCHRTAVSQADFFGAAKRAEMANIEQNEEADLDFGVQIDSVKQPIQNNSVGP